MAKTIYGSYVSAQDSNGNYMYIRPFLKYTVTSDATSVSVTFSCGINDEKNTKMTQEKYPPCVTASGTGQSQIKVSKELYITSTTKSVTYITSRTWKWDRGDTDVKKTISAKVTFPSGSHFAGKSSTVSYEVTVPATSKYTVAYDANGGENAPDQQVKTHGTPITLSSSVPTKEASSTYTYTFNKWTTNADGTGTSYNAGATYSEDANVTLYAQYTASVIPTPSPTPTPTYYNPSFTVYSVEDADGYEEFTVGYSKVKIKLEDINWGGASCQSIVATVGSETLTFDEEVTEIETENVIQTAGDYEVEVTITSTQNLSATAYCGVITAIEPKYDVVGGTGQNDFKVQKPIPTEYSRGSSTVGIQAYNYTSNVYETIKGAWAVRVLEEPEGADPIWTIDGIRLDKQYINNGAYQIKVAFTIYVTDRSEGRQAFFSTTKNALFTSGLANNVFVSGCTAVNYSSRAWYSYPNNPLYFPDTNYVEVGANDTAIMGMIKCGEYLAVVKQAKPTDTSIYMLYPTSYDDNTTYAIRQSISGNGSQSRFSFNVLNDEALFLSPEGVTAIVLSEDNQHKLQNRSYYINKPLLKENLENAYSFIYNGMYLLSVPKEDDENGNKMGKIFVLDGNQMTSWETSKTNLQYEGYVWEGVTAWCLMRYDNELWFSDKGNVYRFKTEDDYDAETGENNKYKDDGSPVKATWSTIFDNDGATNYYKSLQKRGNVVTLNGSDLTSARVYFQKDENERILIKDIETKFTYKRAYPSSTEFNAHKEWYFVYDGKNYIKCIGKTYDSSEEYYMLDFENISGYPIDIFTKKKMKKYKRLQISIENNRAESFGVREIVKTYTIGNYAKK